MIIFLTWGACGFLAWGVTLGYFSKRFPAFGHVGVSLFAAVFGPLGLFSSLVCSAIGGGIYWRLKPATKAERWAAHQKLWPGLSYEYFELTD